MTQTISSSKLQLKPLEHLEVIGHVPLESREPLITS